MRLPLRYNIFHSLRIKCPVCCHTCKCRSCIKKAIEKAGKYRTAESKGPEGVAKWMQHEIGYKKKRRGPVVALSSGLGVQLSGSNPNNASTHSDKKRKRPYRADVAEEGAGTVQILEESLKGESRRAKSSAVSLKVSG